MGSMVLPVTLQLLFSKKHADQMHVESVFSTEGFQIVQDGRELNLTRERIVRTLHVGLPTLPTSEWSPKKVTSGNRIQILHLNIERGRNETHNY